MSEETKIGENKEIPATGLQPSNSLDSHHQLSDHQLRFLKQKGITFEKRLGSGTYGEVWVVRQKCTVLQNDNKIDEPLACKILVVSTTKEIGSNDKSTGPTVLQVTQQSDTYNDLNHLNVIKRVHVINALHETKLGFPQRIIVIEFMALMEGNLLSLLESDIAKDSQSFTYLWLKQVLSGLKYLHENNVFHLDIKPTNILYTTDGEKKSKNIIFKITDFGLTTNFQPKECTSVGQPKPTLYTAPEAMSLKLTNPSAADVYSLGVTMAETIGAGKCSLDKVLISIKSQDQNIATELKVSTNCVNLILTMIKEDPSERPTIIDVTSHEWVKQMTSTPFDSE